jgi:predicted amidohydrolase
MVDTDSFQPSFMQMILDDEPTRAEDRYDSPSARYRAYKESVMRDLEQLLNHRSRMPFDQIDHDNEVLLTYGVTDFAHINISALSGRDALRRKISDAIQWQMREVSSVEELLKQVEYFIDALSNYKSDFALFPEFFNAPLMGLSPDQRNQTEAIRFVAGFTERFKLEMSQMAVSYNINVITGSLPLIEGDRLYNVSYLCRRDGTIEEQKKIHITPHERRDWVINGGHDLRVFETDAGRVGILICYDVEFPELGRLLADQDMDILFVPFWTDTKNGYLRVRNCAQARAIENECYVVICGSCGNLPQVENLDVQYSQAAVFSPSDFSYPHDAVMAETTPNTEMIMFSDLDLDKLKLTRSEGSVNNLKDRRKDLYSLKWEGVTNT